jgi:hypothetical protein
VDRDYDGNENESENRSGDGGEVEDKNEQGTGPGRDGDDDGLTVPKHFLGFHDHSGFPEYRNRVSASFAVVARQRIAKREERRLNVGW